MDLGCDLIAGHTGHTGHTGHLSALSGVRSKGLSGPDMPDGHGQPYKGCPSCPVSVPDPEPILARAILYSRTRASSEFLGVASAVPAGGLSLPRVGVAASETARASHARWRSNGRGRERASSGRISGFATGEFSFSKTELLA
jgi:hypothetical protein